MLQKQEQIRWQDRWISLSEAMTSLKENIENSSIEAEVKVTFVTLVDGLKTEGRKQFASFHDGFSNNPKGDKFEKDRPRDNRVRFSKEYALRKVLDRVAYDLDVISRAFDQRVVSGDDSPRGRILKQADMLAREALRPAKQRGLISEDTAALTYLQKSFETRVIPYAEVSLVGIPLTSICQAEDLLAIPHEIGHYVFWNGDTKNEKWKKKLETLRKEPFSWTEEIFADVYGCIVAGPVMALDFQDLQLEFAGPDPESGTNEFENGVVGDNEHPTPILRPRIYTKTLKRMKDRDLSLTKPGDLESMADLLDNRWNAKLAQRGYSPESADPTQEQLEDITRIIDEVLGIFEPEANIQGVWSEQAVSDPEYLYDDFKAYAGQADCSQEEIELLEEAVTPGKGVKLVKDWLEKLKAKGWTTKGPHGRS